jgi:hypothetical protein
MTKRTRKNIPKGFDSWLEFDLSKELRQCKFHTEKIPYIQRKTYEPDFIFYDEEEELLTYIEVKGRFRDRAEAKKYVDIRDSLTRNIDLECAYELVFVFQNPKTAMPFARKRADGTKFTMAEWADKNGFTYYTPESLPNKWRFKR